MASIHREKRNGKFRYRLQFYDRHNQRRSIRLGRINKKDADAICAKVERLVSASVSGTPLDNETSRWVADLGDDLAEKLANVGLIPKRTSASLGDFLDDYVASRIDVKPSTRTVLGHTRRNLLSFFGAEKALREITRGDADRWRLDLVGQGLSENTIRRRCGIAKQFFRAAHRSGHVDFNAFEDLHGSVTANRARDYFVTEEEARKVLVACPDGQWRLLFALSRYGGLRCPSEHLGLRWCDVDWDRSRVTIRSPKTEHHPGGESRVIPLFPELRPHLEQAWEQAKPGTDFVITKYRQRNTNLRTQLCKIIRRAGLKPWPTLFQNLRATRQTELAERFPAHVVCAWIGNSRVVAEKHYLQVTDEHYALGVVQLSVLQPAAESRTAPHDDSAAQKKTPVLQGRATLCDSAPNDPVGGTGLEPVTSAV